MLIRAHTETEVSGSSQPSPLRGEWYSFNYYLCTMEQSALRTWVWHSCALNKTSPMLKLKCIQIHGIVVASDQFHTYGYNRKVLWLSVYMRLQYILCYRRQRGWGSSAEVYGPQSCYAFYNHKWKHEVPSCVNKHVVLWHTIIAFPNCHDYCVLIWFWNSM